MNATGAGSVIPITRADDEALRLATAARAAAQSWRRLPLDSRLTVIRRFRTVLAAEAATVAAMIAKRPAIETLSGEILPILEACRFLERNAARVLTTRRASGRVGAWLAGMQLEIGREPFGTVLIIAPSNYALMLPAVQALQALAAGNSVLIKPAPHTGPVLARFAALLAAGGLPAGVLGILDDSIEASARLLDGHVDKVVFTGSSRTGQEVLRRSAEQLVPATVELSGWDACIVLDSADIDRAARAIAFSLTFNSGETCMAPRRILVAASQHDALVGRLTELLRRAAPARFGERIGREAAALIEEAITRGAVLATGGIEDGLAHGPVLLTNVDESMRIFSIEVFGPIALVSCCDDVGSAVMRANATAFGLGATIFGDEPEARRVARELDVGIVMINDAVVAAAHPALPIAARRGSGFGATRGAEGLLELTRPKAVVCNRARRPLHLGPHTPADRDLILAYIEVAYGRGFRARWRGLLALLAAGRKRFFRENAS